MAQDATLHVKLDRQTADKLKRLAAERQTSKGQLVRDAISACYLPALDELPVQQRRALAAYQGGYISLGKLAREMGMHVLGLRAWLADQGLEQHVVFADGDSARA